MEDKDRIIEIFDKAMVQKLDELEELEQSSDENDEDEDLEENEETPYAEDENYEYYDEEDDDYDEEEIEEEEESIELGSIINIGDKLMFGDEDKDDFTIEMECVFKTEYKNNIYVLFHPLDAPDDSQFVPMRIDLDEDDNEPVFSPITIETIAEEILALYKNGENVETNIQNVNVEE